MGVKSKIEWTDATWTPIRARVKLDAPHIALAKGYTSLVQIAGRMAGRVGPHCEHVSPGCEMCYSGMNNGRCLPKNGTGLPFDRRGRDLVDIFLDEKLLFQPLKWRRHINIFTCSQTDLYGEFVHYKLIDIVFAVMALSHCHTFQVLSKRAERMESYFSDLLQRQEAIARAADQLIRAHGSVVRSRWKNRGIDVTALCQLPLRNVMLGVSVEDKAHLYRIEHLLTTPAALRFVSIEPLLEDLGDLSTFLTRRCSGCGLELTASGQRCPTDGCVGRRRERLDWVIVGGESGRRARQCQPAWVRSIRDQCISAKIPFFLKQWGHWAPVDSLDDLGISAAKKRMCNGMVPVGKDRAGRLLDGRTWDERPQFTSADHGQARP